MGHPKVQTVTEEFRNKVRAGLELDVTCTVKDFRVEIHSQVRKSRKEG